MYFFYKTIPTHLLHLILHALIRLLQRIGATRQLREYIPVRPGHRLIDTDLIPAALQPLLRRDDRLPREQLLEDLETRVLYARMQVHRLISDPDLVHHRRYVRITARFVCWLVRNVCVHAVVDFLLFAV